MEITWRWNRLSGTEKRVAEFLLEGRANKDICEEMFLSRARVQECIRRIVKRTGAESTRSAIVLLAQERETAALLRVLEQATDGVAILQGGIVRFANGSLAKITGYDVEEMIGLPFTELVPPEGRGLQSKRHDDRMKGVPLRPRYETAILCKGGIRKQLGVSSASLVRFNGRPAMIATAFETEQTPAAETAQRVGRCGQPCCLLAVQEQGVQAELPPAKLPSYCVWR